MLDCELTVHAMPDRLMFLESFQEHEPREIGVNLKQGISLKLWALEPFRVHAYSGLCVRED